MLTKELFEKTVQARIAVMYGWSPDELAIEWKGSTCIARALVGSEVTVSYQLDNVYLEDLFGEKADLAYSDMLVAELAARLNYQYQQYKDKQEVESKSKEAAWNCVEHNTDKPLDSNLDIAKDPPIRFNTVKLDTQVPTRMSFEPGCGILFHDGGEILSESDIHFSYTGKLTIGDLKKRE